MVETLTLDRAVRRERRLVRDAHTLDGCRRSPRPGRALHDGYSAMAKCRSVLPQKSPPPLKTCLLKDSGFTLPFSYLGFGPQSASVMARKRGNSCRLC